MPPSGAVFSVVFIGLLQLRLILAEESFLAAKLGQSYAEYCARVPRLLFSITPRVAKGGAHAKWLQAILGEIYMVLAAAAFAILGWRYNETLLIQSVLVALGVSLVVRAILPRRS
jgi:protein-S-isoprenylcysteine O-methyltransferase Ste14